MIDVHGFEEGVYVFFLGVEGGVEDTIGICQDGHCLFLWRMYFDGVDDSWVIFIVEWEEVVGNLFCALDIGQSRIDKMSLTIFLNLKNGSD